MFASRTATGLAVALLALPATAAAQTAPLPDQSGGGDSGSPSYSVQPARVEVRPNPDQRSAAPPEGDRRPFDDTPPWPEIAFAGAVLLAAAGGLVRVRLRRARPAGAAPFGHDR